jgi:hypothetical protein
MNNSDFDSESLIEDAYNSGERCTVSFSADCLFFPLLGPQNLNLIFSAVDSALLPPAHGVLCDGIPYCDGGEMDKTLRPQTHATAASASVGRD